MGRFMIRRVATGFKFDLRAGNGEVVATSEVYKTEAACRKGMDSVRKNAPRAGIQDLTGPEVPLANPKFQLYQDKAGTFRFRLLSRNGNIIAVSEAYNTRQGCLEGIESVKNNIIFEEITDFSGNKY